jgi:hypothetical protein
MIKNRNKNLCKGYALLTCVLVTVILMGLMFAGLLSLNSAKSSYVTQSEIDTISDYRKAYASAFTRYLTVICNEKLSIGESEMTFDDLETAIKNTDDLMAQNFSTINSGYVSPGASPVSSSESYAEAYFSPIHGGGPTDSVDLVALDVLTFENPDSSSIATTMMTSLDILSSGHPCVGLKGKRFCVLLSVAAALPGREWDSSEFQVSYFQIPMSQFARATNGDLSLNSTVGKNYIYADTNIFSGGDLDADVGALTAAGLLNGSSSALVGGALPDRIQEDYTSVYRDNVLDGSVTSGDVEGSESIISATRYSGLDMRKIRADMKSEGGANIVGSSMLKRREFLFGTEDVINVSDWTPPPWNWMSKTINGIQGEDRGTAGENWFRWRLEDLEFTKDNNLGVNSDSNLNPISGYLFNDTQELSYRDFSYGRSLAAKADWLFRFVYTKTGVNVLKTNDELVQSILEHNNLPSSISRIDTYKFLDHDTSVIGSLIHMTLYETLDYLRFNYSIVIDEYNTDYSNRVTAYGFQMTEDGYVQNYSSTFTDTDVMKLFTFSVIPGDESYNNFAHDVIMIDIDLDAPIPVELQSLDNTELSWYLRGAREDMGRLTVGNVSEADHMVVFRVTGESFGAPLPSNNLSTLNNISLAFSNPVILSDFNGGTPHESVTLSVPHTDHDDDVDTPSVPELYMSLTRGAGAETTFSGAVYADTFIPRSYFEYDGSREYEKFTVDYSTPINASEMTNWRRFSLVDYGSDYTKLF